MTTNSANAPKASALLILPLIYTVSITGCFFLINFRVTDSALSAAWVAAITGGPLMVASGWLIKKFYLLSNAQIRKAMFGAVAAVMWSALGLCIASSVNIMQFL